MTVASETVTTLRAFLFPQSVTQQYTYILENTGRKQNHIK